MSNGSMADLIYREQAIEIAIDIACNLDRDWEYEQIASAMDNAFEKIPSARPKGKWIKGMSENGVTTSLFCSNCGCENSHWYDWNFCPNCGSEMQEVEE